MSVHLGKIQLESDAEGRISHPGRSTIDEDSWH